jgi:hypothetical protein
VETVIIGKDESEYEQLTQSKSKELPPSKNVCLFMTLLPQEFNLFQLTAQSL